MHTDAFETLADPTRRRILATLRDGEQPVGEIVRHAGIHQSGVSRHLRILHDSGFVSVRPEGQRRLYALRPEPFRELEAWLGDYRRLWGAPGSFRRRARGRTHQGRRRQGAIRAMSSANLSAGAAPPQAVIVTERTYRAPIEDLWALWTTKAGFESWWGPEGCRVEVHVLEARAGGALEYDMIADAPEAIAAMRSLGLPSSPRSRGRFGEFRPHERLTLVHVMDFIPGVEPYEHTIEVDFSSASGRASMVVTVRPHFNPQWTKMAVDGFNSQLARLDRRFGWPGRKG